MVDFKPLEEITFDDCVKSIERHKTEGTSVDEELLSRYNSLLEALKAEEKQDYPSIKTIDSLEHYIKKYSSLTTASRYKPQYLAKAKQELAELNRKELIKRHIKICSSICVLILIISVVIYIGYRPVGNIYLNSSLNSQIEFNASSSHEEFNMSSDGSNDFLHNSPSCDWCKVEMQGNKLIITVQKNVDDTRRCNFDVYSYNELYGERLNKITKRIEIVQESGKATYLNITETHFDIDKLGAGFGANYNFTVTTDGSDVVEPVIDAEDWVTYNRTIVSKLPLEIKYVLKIEKNPSSERAIELKFATYDGSIVKNVTINQESGYAKYFRRKGGDSEIYVSKDALPEGKCYAIDIETDGTSWSVVSCPDWITYRIVGDRLEINPTTWIKDNSRGIQIGRFGDIILRSNNPELEDVTLSVSQGLLD